MKQYKLMLGDNITSLKKIPDNSIDSIITDPPYGLNFMNKKWDYDVPSVEFWQEVYRVLKPGGHILSFGGTRTYHRMVVNIEDAGFEIRDQIMWIYGSGFPKSHNIGKAVDKIEGNKREVVGKLENYQDKRGLNGQANVMENAKPRIDIDLTKGNSAFEGYGTALKPANEPICVARKPISEKTVAANMMKWGTGGINVDGCRIGYVNEADEKSSIPGSLNSKQSNSMFGMGEGHIHNSEGRFPANIIFDEEAAELLDQQSGVSKSINRKFNTSGNNNFIKLENKYEGGFNDKGGASRFFYVAKVSKKERNMGLDGFEDKVTRNMTNVAQRIIDGYIVDNPKETIHKNNHPTVKPINLMTYLIRFVTPENGIVLEPFMGSGSTGIAAMLEGRRFVGMEQDESYFKIAEKRIESWEQYKKLIK